LLALERKERVVSVSDWKRKLWNVDLGVKEDEA